MPMTSISPKLYTIRDIPHPPGMADYLSRVRAVSERLLSGTPDPPQDMDALTFREANNIELALLGAERAINSMEKSFVCSGEMEAGGF